MTPNHHRRTELQAGRSPVPLYSCLRRIAKSASRAQWERDVLSVDASGMEKCGPGEYIEVRDKVVTARKGGTCTMCFGQIIPGTRIRSLTAVLDGKIGTERFCNECCNAMAESRRDDGDALEKRYSMGMAAARQLESPNE